MERNVDESTPRVGDVTTSEFDTNNECPSHQGHNSNISPESDHNEEKLDEKAVNLEHGSDEKTQECSDEHLQNQYFESESESSKFDEEYVADDDDEEEDEEDGNDEEREEVESKLNSQELEERLQQAQLLKDEGNNFFRANELPEAITCYSKAVTTCPIINKKERSIYFSNRAACYVKMEKYKKAIKGCSKALELNSGYMKARLRRAQCYEHEDRLEEALEDYQKVFESDRSNDVAREAVMRLPEQIKIKHEKLKEEMFGKLKDLGNLVLKPFGLSTENFQMQQDPNSGGYSINFKK